MLTDQQHPITPTPELVQQWLTEGHHQDYCSAANHAIAQAARWGFRQCIKVDAAWLEDKLQKARDQELEACMEWMRSHFHGVPQWADELRDARRPKPPSLAEQALEACERSAFGIPGDRDIIRRALERLQELEKGNE